MNSKLKRVFFGFGCAVSLFACGSTGVSAEWEDLYGISEGTYFLIIFSPILVVVVVFLIMYLLYKKGYDIFRTGENNRFNTLFRENHPEGLSTDEQIMLDKLKEDLKSKKPDPVNVRCPNCGAPLSVTDKVMCPYCRSELTNRTFVKAEVRRHDVVMTDQNVDPMRYYKENVTGYKRLDPENSQQGSRTADSSGNSDFDSSYRFGDRK